MSYKKYDVIIVGSGVSGLYAAYNLNKDLKILNLSKKELTLCNSALAQGGVAAVIDDENDSAGEHFKDTLIAGGYRNNKENLEILVREGPRDIENLLTAGVDFDRKENGQIHLTLEGGHTKRRIAHHKDSTGYAIVSKLIERVQGLDNVDILEFAHLCELDKTDDGFYAHVLCKDEHLYYTAPYVILATGGIGRIYEFTTNSAIATGDGIYFAHKLGAEIKNLSLVQFHPTAFANKSARECFLISEAVRGEGAYLLNCNKERFMHNYDQRLELAPRDIVSKSIMLESKKTGSRDFYLDISHKEEEFIKTRFPMIYNNILKYGFDITKEPVPIFPCQHYLMGGINVNGKGETSIENLYAAGECSHTGVHGNNRLASNSLLEALVFSRLIADEINIKSNRSIDYIPNFEIKKCNSKDMPKGIRTEIRAIMQKAYFITPSIIEAEKGIERIKTFVDLLENESFTFTSDYIEAKSLATIAYIILTEIIEKYKLNKLD